MMRFVRRLLIATFCVAVAPLIRAQVPVYSVSTVTAALNPSGLALDAAGNLYISDLPNNRIYKLSTTGGIASVAGGGPVTGFNGDGGLATTAILNNPTGVAVDAAGNLYISEASRIRKVTASTGRIATVAGPGPANGALGDGGQATGATLKGPQGVAVDPAGNLYIADTGNHRIRKVSPDGIIATVAAYDATALAPDTKGNLYFTDPSASRVRKVAPDGSVTTVAGNGSSAYSGDGGLAIIAALNAPGGVAADATGNLYIADSANGRIRLVTPDGNINTIGTSSGAQAIALGTAGRLYIAEPRPSGLVRLLTSTGAVTSPGPSIAALLSASAFGQFAQLSPGSWAEIYGSYLSTNSLTWSSAFSGVNAPTSLDGTSVTIGGEKAFLSYVSPGQINLQVPSGVSAGTQPLVVTTKAGVSAALPVVVNDVEPGLLAPGSFAIRGPQQDQYAVALFPDGVTFVLPVGAIPGVPSRPARAGDTITLYGVGFGSVVPDTPAGQVVPGINTLSRPFHLYFGAAEATVSYAGLAPGSVGLYQFNVVVPTLNAPGDQVLSFTLGGQNGTQRLFMATQ